MGDVVINELMWMGTSYSPYDEYLELRNMTALSVDFSATPWSIYKNDELMLVIDTGVLPPFGYFLISRLDTSLSALAVSPDMVTPDLVLNNSDVQYRLYAGPDSSWPLVDVADDGAGAPLEGRYGGASGSVFWSMERNDPPGDGTSPERWHHACLTVNFDPGAFERGTPKAPNVKNVPPQWDGVLAPSAAEDDSNVAFFALNCRDPDNLPDSLEVLGVWWQAGVWLPVYSCALYGVREGDTVSVVLPAGFTEPVQKYIWRIMLDDGADTVYAAGTLFVHLNRGDVVIDEVCWCGSSKSSADEWIELWNRRTDDLELREKPLYIWRGTAFGEIELAAVLDTGLIPAGGRVLVKRIPQGDPQTVVAEAPIAVSEDLSMPDSRVFVGVTDAPDTSFWVDVAGFGGAAPAGEVNPAESLWATMARASPEANGTLPDAWRTSTASVGFIPGVLDRGTPGFPDVPNAPPVLAPLESLPTFAPDTGTRDTAFVFRVVYADADTDPPWNACLLIDADGDGTWEPTETFPLSVADGSPDFASGVVLEAHVSGLAPTLAGHPFSFRASDSLVTVPFPAQAKPGPVVLPTAGIELSTNVWRTDTLHMFSDRVATSPEITLRNTGDLPAQLRLRIAKQDTFEHDCCYSTCEGGWASTCDPHDLYCNKYVLSALFLPIGVVPDTSWFNEYGADDCLLPNRYLLARGDTLGYGGICAAEDLPPGQTAQLRFMLQLPALSAGRHVDEEHIITVELWCVVKLP